MDDHNAFLERMLAPLQNAAEQRPDAAPGNAGAVEPATLSPAELERRYIEVMNALLEHAMKQRAVEVFTEVVSWKLAAVAFHWGPRSAGDIVRRFGTHLANHAEAAEAQREVEAAQQAGQKLN